jgi:integrase
MPGRCVNTPGRGRDLQRRLDIAETTTRRTRAAQGIVKRSTGKGTVYDVRIRIGGRQVSKTFARRKDADDFLHSTHHAKDRGLAVDPRAGRISLGEYAATWLSERRTPAGEPLRRTTKDLYAHLLRTHIEPTFGPVRLVDIDLAAVRRWHDRLAEKASPITAAKAYRLLRAIVATAVADGRIARNPCQVTGAAVERSPERPVATVAEVDALAHAIEPRYRAMVLLAAWCSLRFGELAALTPAKVDLLHGVIRVEHSVTEAAGKPAIGPPKTDAGRRTVSIPPHILDELRSAVAGLEPDALVFPGQDGGYLTRSWWRRRWNKALTAAKLDYHLHDLRHAGNTWMAAQGASVAELMRRMGHASPAVALRYQHATEDRDQALARAMSEMVTPAEVVPLPSAERHR